MAKKKKATKKKKTTKKTQKKKTSKKRTRRDQVKHAALDPTYTTRNRREYHDINEYHFPLNEEEKEWLNKFMEGHLNASFKESNSDIFNTKEQKKISYDSNNARNRDLYGIAKVNNLTQDVTTTTVTDFQKNHSSGHNLTEDAMIAQLDNSRMNEEFDADDGEDEDTSH